MNEIQLNSLSGSLLREQPVPLNIRKILVFGAGVLGSLYAGKLQQAGYEVTLLARGKRLAELNDRGLQLVEDGSERLERIPVTVTDRLGPNDAYDLVVVIVRKNQVPSVLPLLAANKKVPSFLFLVNNAEGSAALIRALGRDRILLGFPGAGGQMVDGVVRYRVTKRMLQATTLGELDGKITGRLEQIALAFQRAGFPVALSRNMDAWLKTHVALVSPIANAIYLAGGSNYRLAHTRDGLVLMVRGIKEGLGVLNALGIPITPAKFRVLAWLPEPLLVAVLKIGFDTPQAELVMARHANAARDEMLTLADEFRGLARRSGLATPAIDTLYPCLDPAYPTLPEGQAHLPLVWGPMLAMLGGLVSLGLLGGWLLRKKSEYNNND